SRGVALVEDQIDNLEDRAKARHALGAARDLEPNVRLVEGPLRADDALSDARDRDEEPPCDLLGGQAAEDPQGKGDARVLRQDRMARHEDETEEIVADVLFDRRVQVLDLLIAFSVASELFIFALEGLAAPDQVSGAVLRGSHQPSARPLRHAWGRPLLDRG